MTNRRNFLMTGSRGLAELLMGRVTRSDCVYATRAADSHFSFTSGKRGFAMSTTYSLDLRRHVVGFVESGHSRRSGPLRRFGLF
jgi:hypothetical protein